MYNCVGAVLLGGETVAAVEINDLMVLEPFHRGGWGRCGGWGETDLQREGVGVMSVGGD